MLVMARRMAAGTALVILLACAMDRPPAAATAPPQPGGGAAAITEISFERQCFGCEGAYAATLRADGTATRVFHGNARAGIAPRTLKGRLERTEFERLGALLLAEDFFGLKDAYRDAETEDGEWVTTGAVRSSGRKAVVDSNRAGPANLNRNERAVEAVVESIVWMPDAQR